MTDAAIVQDLAGLLVLKLGVLMLDFLAKAGRLSSKHAAEAGMMH